MARGRAQTKTSSPVLVWPGKRLPEPPSNLNARLLEIYAPTNLKLYEIARQTVAAGSANTFDVTSNSLWYGDNWDVLTHLLANGYAGRVKLIYIDPPFDSGVQHRRKIRLRTPKALTMQTNAARIFGEQTQFDDRWNESDYLQFIYARLPLLRELLADDGSLWLHCDHRQAHHLRVLLQEVFGEENYLNTVVWRSQVARGAKVNAFYFPFSTHFLEIFAKRRHTPTTWNLQKRQIVLTEQEAAQEFMQDARGFFRTSDPGSYSFASLQALHSEGRLYAPYGGEIVVDATNQQVYASQGGNIGVKYYLTSLAKGKYAVERAIDNLWDDIPGLGVTPGEDLGYPTQKTEALLERVIRTASQPDDLVLDCFMGSGTTLAVAQRLGRRWIGCDNNWGALLTTRRRLQAMSARASAVNFALYQIEQTQSPPASQVSSTLQAQVEIVRALEDPALLQIRVVNVVSPAIVALVSQSTTKSRQSIEDWRALVDVIAIDPHYNGKFFNSQLVDAPLKKSEQVHGVYTIAAGREPRTVAVRITDLLGEETLVIRNI
jgi:DNA modification methylase